MSTVDAAVLQLSAMTWVLPEASAAVTAKARGMCGDKGLAGKPKGPRWCAVFCVAIFMVLIRFWLNPPAAALRGPRKMRIGGG